MKFTEEQMATIDQNLKPGRCPYCGSEEKKVIFPEVVDIFLRKEFFSGQDRSNDIVAKCPECGYMLFFNKETVLNRQ